MKKLTVFRRNLLNSISLLIFVASISCQLPQDRIENQIKVAIDEISVINTHEHQRAPHDLPDYRFGFYHLLEFSYLGADIRSAGSSGFPIEKLDSLDAETLWQGYGKGLEFSRNTSYYGQFAKGFQRLYHMENIQFTRENIQLLTERIEDNYKDYKKWFDKAFNEAGFELMFIDQYWNPFNCVLDSNYFALVFHINPLVMQSSQRPDPDEEKWGIYLEAEAEGYSIGNFDDYLDYCNHLFIKNVEHHAVCVKNSMAYSRSLYYEEVPYEEAKTLFEKPSSSLTKDESKKIQDFMFHWIIRKSATYDLPVQIHTGYLAGNSNILDNGQPVKLNNLFIQYPEAKFVLFHGGFPWTGEYAAFGKMFPNVYLDIVWLPQISREEAVNALDIMLDCMPYNKFFWGGDCALIEESVGSLEFAKDVVIEVLTNRVGRGLLTVDVAKDIARSIFRENAVETFHLEDRLQRVFGRSRM